MDCKTVNTILLLCFECQTENHKMDIWFRENKNPFFALALFLGKVFTAVNHLQFWKIWFWQITLKSMGGIVYWLFSWWILSPWHETWGEKVTKSTYFRPGKLSCQHWKYFFTFDRWDKFRNELFEQAMNEYHAMRKEWMLNYKEKGKSPENCFYQPRCLIQENTER